MTACLSLCDLEDDLSPCDLEPADLSPCDLPAALSCDLLLELLSPFDLLEDLSLCDLSLCPRTCQLDLSPLLSSLLALATVTMVSLAKPGLCDLTGLWDLVRSTEKFTGTRLTRVPSLLRAPTKVRALSSCLGREWAGAGFWARVDGGRL